MTFRRLWLTATGTKCHKFLTFCVTSSRHQLGVGKHLKEIFLRVQTKRKERSGPQQRPWYSKCHHQKRTHGQSALGHPPMYKDHRFITDEINVNHYQNKVPAQQFCTSGGSTKFGHYWLKSAGGRLVHLTWPWLWPLTLTFWHTKSSDTKESPNSKMVWKTGAEFVWETAQRVSPKP